MNSSETPADLVAGLTRQGHAHLYVDGGKTIQGFLAANLIDEITITTVPVLLGSGRPLCGSLPTDRKLTLVAERVRLRGNVCGPRDRNCLGGCLRSRIRSENLGVGS